MSIEKEHIIQMKCSLCGRILTKDETMSEYMLCNRVISRPYGPNGRVVTCTGRMFIIGNLGMPLRSEAKQVIKLTRKNTTK